MGDGFEPIALFVGYGDDGIGKAGDVRLESLHRGRFGLPELALLFVFLKPHLNRKALVIERFGVVDDLGVGSARRSSSKKRSALCGRETTTTS